MAHEYAKVNIAIWGDQKWKQLPLQAQWLYFLLWTHPKTNAAGVGEWNPGRLAKHAENITSSDIEKIGSLLQSRRFILIDDDEVLIRSYIKHDQRMKQPNAAVSVINAYSGTASVPIQKVIVHELRELREQCPDFKGFTAEGCRRAVEGVLKQDAEPIDSYIDPSPDPSNDPRADPSVDSQPYISVDPSIGHPLTETETETLPKGSSAGTRKKPSRPLPGDWQPTEGHQQKALEQGVNLSVEAERFKLHAEANDRRAVNWNAAFSMWLSKAQPPHVNGPQPSAADRVMQRAQARHEQMANYTPTSWDDVFQTKQIGDGA